MRTQQLSCWLVALCACGRIGFDASTDGSTSASGWLDPAWGFRKPLIIDHTQVAADLVEFPVLVQLELAEADPLGADLRFVDTSGNVLPHELNRLGVTVVAPQVFAWVKVPAVSATVDTTIYVYYGNPAATDAQRPEAVWLGYAGVYHLDDGNAPAIADAAGRNPGSNFGVTAAPGWVLGAAMFPGGIDTNVRAGAVAVDTSPGGYNTVSFWLKYTGAYGDATFAFVQGATGYDLWMEGSPCFGFNTENSDVLGVPASPLVMRWVHVVGVFYNGMPDATNNELWVDGVRMTIAQCTGTPQPRTAGDIILGSGGTYSLSGVLDEVRIIAGHRPPGWLLTEYRNQADARAFVRPGPVELAP